VESVELRARGARGAFLASAAAASAGNINGIGTSKATYAGDTAGPTTRTGPDVASLRNEGSLFMRHVLVAFMLVMSISSDGVANETQLHWTYLKYDGSTASATLKIDTVRRPQRFTLVLSDFNKSIEVYSVAYSVVSRLRIPEELGIAALADPTAKLKGVVLSGRPKDIQEARETMLLVNQTALTKYSREELCPPRTDHVLWEGTCGHRCMTPRLARHGANARRDRRARQDANQISSGIKKLPRNLAFPGRFPV
jgi:hypothetical protein